jgi:ABC-type uncharacterized transport system involved in gliding motility auxiliary subunit
MVTDKATSQKQSGKSGINLTVALWTATLISGIGLVFARLVYPELLWATIALAVLFVACTGLLIKENQKALRTRTVAFGVNSIVTVLLVVAITAVLNFLVARYPQKLDLTKTKKHTLSEQTVKVVKGLKQEVKATLFAKFAEREEMRQLLDNYKSLNPKFALDFVDPDKEPVRARQLNIRKYGTLHLAYGNREQQVEELNEEKLTNALMKLTQDKVPTFCHLTGHGEKAFNSQEADGYELIRQGLIAQAYETKEVNLLQENKVPEICDALAIIGPSKPLFGNDLKLITEYLANGGRAVIALDLNIKGAEPMAELIGLLRNWHVDVGTALIVDPASRQFGVDAAAPIIAQFAPDSPITREFGASRSAAVFPFVRPVEVLKDAPAGLGVKWLGQTTPNSWAVTDLSKLAKSGAAKLEASDKRGPISVAVAVDGKQKDSKATRNTRLVVFGTSAFAMNQHSGFGLNRDFFLNAVSWALEDENVISIRAKEDAPSKVELSQKEGTTIFLIIALFPLLTIVAGVVVWVRRRRL